MPSVLQVTSRLGLVWEHQRPLFPFQLHEHNIHRLIAQGLQQMSLGEILRASPVALGMVPPALLWFCDPKVKDTIRGCGPWRIRASTLRAKEAILSRFEGSVWRYLVNAGF